MMSRARFVIPLALLAGAVCLAAGWVKLFDGKTLDGWSVHSGTATYEVENGVIVGKTALGSPNTFLCTNKEYGDFILEFEVKVDSELNSGVQFRSQIAKDGTTVTRERDGKTVEEKLPVDRVYGYQVEIAESEHAGNVYDEARRAVFLDSFADRPKARKAFKPGEWNKYRVECRGDSIKTWVNGIACADFKDSMTRRGIIGLQVHAVPKEKYKPYEVRWRNLRIQELD
ncbi:MAG: DUF1080 domain-containing protein [Bryobacteraceae bacterium]|nr:DUF1080 domain-containing protein [Bryobacteraceae bacterium]